MNFILNKLRVSSRARAAVAAREREKRTPKPEGLEIIPDVPYAGPDSSALAADIYRPVCRSGPLPVVVMVHGGGLFVGDRKIDTAFCQVLAGKGFLVFSIEYRLIDEADGCGEISDISAGFSFVSESLSAYGGDPGRVCVIAESAGAFLSVYAAVMTKSDALANMIGGVPAQIPIRALVCLSGMFYTTKPDLIGLVYRSSLYGSRRKDKQFMRRMNPEHIDVISNLPPLLLISSSADYLKRYTLRYAKALRKAGHPCELLYYKKDKNRFNRPKESSSETKERQ